MTTPPNMTDDQYRRYRILQDASQKTNAELTELRTLAGLSISHMQFNYPARIKSESKQKSMADTPLFDRDTTGRLI